MLEHPTYDEFWSSRALAPHMKNVTPAVLFVGGWFDAEDLAGPLKLFHALEENGPAAPNTLVMGPWPHGGWSHLDGDKLGNLDFGSKTGEFYREHIELPFFVSMLKGKGEGLKPTPASQIPKAWLFETGKMNGAASMPGRPRVPGAPDFTYAPEASCHWIEPRQIPGSTNTSAIRTSPCP